MDVHNSFLECFIFQTSKNGLKYLYHCERTSEQQMTQNSSVHRSDSFQLMRNLWVCAAMGEMRGGMKVQWAPNQEINQRSGQPAHQCQENTALSRGAAKALPPPLSRTEILPRDGICRVWFLSYICSIPCGTNYCVLAADMAVINPLRQSRDISPSQHAWQYAKDVRGLRGLQLLVVLRLAARGENVPRPPMGERNRQALRPFIFQRD